MKGKYLFFILIASALSFNCQNEKKMEAEEAYEIEWQQLFNGKDLTGWTPKISGHELGDNNGETFSVVDGNITVNYDNYENFDQQFGHLFYEKPFSAYFLAIEYRFIGDQIHDGPGWAYRNSGAMLHGQDPKTMTIEQDFPISIEGQILGGNGQNDRTTSNLCTPGTNVVMKGELFTPHCVNSSSKTYHGDQWVRASFLVLKDSLIQHILEGDVVLEYTSPQMGGGNVAPVKDGVMQEGKLLTEGSISLQSESHPIQFRKVEIVDLDPIYDNKTLLSKTVESLIEGEKITN